MNAETNILSPFVNTDVRMPKKLLEALTLHEFYCCSSNIKKVSEANVRSFLNEHYGASMSDKFRPEYLINTQVS